MRTENVQYAENVSTTISYALPERSRVELVVYDLLGREIARLVEGEQEAGCRSVEFGPGAIPRIRLPGGIYVCRIRAANPADPARTLSVVQKMILLK